MKKFLLLIASIVMAVCTALGVAACGDDQLQTTKYEFYVQSTGGQYIYDVTVCVYDSNDEIVKTLVTDENGYASVSLPKKSYTFTVSNLPTGYGLSGEPKTEGTKTTFLLASGIITGANAPSDLIYKTGDVMYDFTVTAINGNEYNLASLVSEKKMVMLNFWYTTCTFCIQEFPWIQSVYEDYSSEIEILGLNPYPGDTREDVISFSKNDIIGSTLQFPLIVDTSVASHFAITGYPTTVIIDRYGVIVWMHSARLSNEKELRDLVDKYIADDYTQDQFSPDGSTDEEEIRVLPTVDEPDYAEVLNAVKTDSFNFPLYSRRGEDEYSWPFVPGSGKLGNDGTDRNYIKASNAQVDNSYALVSADITLNENQVFAFDYFASTEEIYDVFTVIVDDTAYFEISGVSEDWETCYAFVPEKAGTYQLTLYYQKSRSESEGDDTVYLSNFRILNASEIDQPTYLLRYAANDPKDKEITLENPEPRYNSYVDVEYNEKDGYYHVGTKNGPLLLASLVNATRWNATTSVSLMGVNGQCIFKGVDYTETLDRYGWIGNNSDVGYTPVTQELKELLELIAEESAFGYGNTDGNEWKEFCVYFEKFGTTEELDPGVDGIWFTSAIEVEEDSDGTTVFEANIDKVLVPRGIKYAFTPKKSGVYSIYSEILTNTTANAASDPVGWIFVEENWEFVELAYNNADITATDNNFRFTLYLEAGTTYYITCGDFDLYFEGQYNVHVDRLADAMKVFSNAAELPYTYEEVTGVIYVPNTTAWKIDDDGFVRESIVDDDGNETLGSYFYLDLLRTTHFLQDRTLKSVIETTKRGYDDVANNGIYRGTGFDFSIKMNIYVEEDEETGQVTVSYEYPALDDDGNVIPSGGENYNPKMLEYLAAATAKDAEIYGFVKVDEDLLEILKAFTERYSGFGAVKDVWQTMCYYFKSYGDTSGDTITDNAPDLRPTITVQVAYGDGSFASTEGLQLKIFENGEALDTVTIGSNRKATVRVYDLNATFTVEVLNIPERYKAELNSSNAANGEYTLVLIPEQS